MPDMLIVIPAKAGIQLLSRLEQFVTKELGYYRAESGHDEWRPELDPGFRRGDE